MLLLTNFTDQVSQEQDIILPDGTTFTLLLQYKSCVLDAYKGWFFSVTSPQLPQGAYAGQKLTCNLNLLSPFINIVNFGLACIGVAGREPWFATDLTDGSISLYLLDSTDIKTVSELLNP